MILSIISSIFILILQAVIFFFLIYLPLSLWHVDSIYAAIASVIFIIIQFFLCAPIYDLFFSVSLKKPDETTEENEEKKSYEKALNEMMKNLNVQCRINLFEDSHPIMLSYGSITGKNRLVISTGLFKLLEPQEIESLMKRESYFLKRADMGIFTTATFLPFIILFLSNWFIETARESRLHRGAGASYLLGAILFYVYRASEFFLLFVSRSRHMKADELLAKPGEKKSLRNAVEKLSREFCKPVQSGPPFRKKIYASLKVFLPFDTTRAQNLVIWKTFSGTNMDLVEMGKILEKNNAFYRTFGIFSTHPPDSRRFPESGKDEHDDIISQKIGQSDIAMSAISLFCFAGGIVAVVISRGFFGLPLITLGIGIIIHLLLRFRKEKKAEGNGMRDFHRVELKGEIIERVVEDPGIEAPYYFIVSDEIIIPVILRQLVRNEDSLINIIGDKVVVDGVVRFEEIPYLDVKSIIYKNKKPGKISSAYVLSRVLVSIFLISAGVLMIAVELGG
ncbi:MAG: M48 family metalloprotease [Candidatus Eremiobacteraeota bacterium]|nr:M48 family metalloprotease [Candidatus Eremiobacteraeota bacterium]